ncbi:Transcription elongation factor [Hahella chejuensis KCTC 2396]|uniref:Transcription elongation factor n=1 Tax=Hahella chejuensis (strain KCTC 2396) TaxID=349521 RepID=Q2SLP2_HAHCH|nr:GreA/GreB family elongation factor [Hahella chejuensis]ABC28432.1 Transcription elongation factor [Hahella chejuensis KCTC 2396]
MRKEKIHQLIIAKLQDDLAVAQQAANTAHATATHEESVAENKYDTFGLEASYLAEGQSRRVREFEAALASYQNTPPKHFTDQDEVAVFALVTLEAEDGSERRLFVGPEAAGFKFLLDEQEVLVITRRSPIGMKLMGKMVGDVVALVAGNGEKEFEIVEIE